MEELFITSAILSIVLLFCVIGCIIGDGLECLIKLRRSQKRKGKESRTCEERNVTSDFRVAHALKKRLSLLTLERSALDSVSAGKECGDSRRATDVTTLPMGVQHQTLNTTFCDEYKQRPRSFTRNI